MTTVGFLGCGRMAQAMIQGLSATPWTLWGCVRSLERASSLAHTFPALKLTQNPNELIANTDLVFLCVKPHQAHELLQDCREALGIHGTPLVSILAQTSLSTLASDLPTHHPLIRLMPNTPVRVNQGICALLASEGTPTQTRQDVQTITDILGQTLWLEREDQFKSITALCGSGPGFVYTVLQAWHQAAQALHIDEPDSLIQQLFQGSLQLAQHTPDDFETLAKAVVCQGGPTEAGIEAFKKQGGFDAIGAMLKAALERA